LDAPHNLDCAAFHEPLIALKEWIALCAIGNDCIHPGRELDVRGKASSPSAYHPGGPYGLDEI
jgi:hypothetical protein